MLFTTAPPLFTNVYDNGKYLGNDTNKYLYLAYTISDNIESITIAETTKLIGEGACSNCTYLTSITIPDSVTSIGKRAFEACGRYMTVNYEGTEEQWAELSADTGISSDVTVNYNYKAQ